MAFIRFVGCSVGKKICNYCDTDFEKVMAWRGGGEFTAEALLEWAKPYEHICLTGGEPLDQDITDILQHSYRNVFHIETSGTREWMVPILERLPGKEPPFSKVYLTVSPKPGYFDIMLERADEIKVIVPGLGNGEGWMGIEEARFWARKKPVFLQPRNAKFDVDKNNLRIVQDIIRDYPEFRLSVQMHKILGVQ